ncbi:MAG TPA: hypothetical protein VFE18_18365 [Phenylobacterium sp.]|jgi:hypothetical protein|uniref:hypothetical protein n=1 Tax=Phenylobacterium sp. TaxID=1871053 RepID=UPI002D2F8EFA|nr:hypothetical protein [Phenylobacterium sp.]HZZ70142.1 hypothetical protein [Phenylobacterium sp.]
MGRSDSWIAVRGIDRPQVVERLGLEETGREVEKWSVFLALGDMPNGWLIVRARDFEYPKPKLLASLSAGAELLSCQVEEHVMVSIARGFRDGLQTWSAVHEPDKGLYSLVVEGTPPPELAVIEQRLRAEQDAEGEDANVDFMFDAAPEIVAAISGYRDDQDQGVVFTELQPVLPPKGPSLLQRLFARR